MTDRCNRRPMFFTNEPDEKYTGFIAASERDLQKFRIIPENLGFNKVNTMFFLIGSAFPLIEFKIHPSINSIPNLYSVCQQVSRPRGLHGARAAK